MTWTIRPIDAGEATCILPLLEQVHALHVEARPDHFPADPDRDELLAFQHDWLSGDAITALVAFDADGSALGYLVCETEPRAPSLLSLGERRGMLHHV
jgi:aminoglycoside 3-N-acetyltransferase I